MTDNDRLEHGDEPPPEAANYELEQNPPDDQGNEDAELKEDTDG